MTRWPTDTGRWAEPEPGTIADERIAAARAAGAPCPLCNDDGTVHDYYGDPLGPCRCVELFPFRPDPLALPPCATPAWEREQACWDAHSRARDLRRARIQARAGRRTPRVLSDSGFPLPSSLVLMWTGTL